MSGLDFADEDIQRWLDEYDSAAIAYKEKVEDSQYFGYGSLQKYVEEKIEDMKNLDLLLARHGEW